MPTARLPEIIFFAISYFLHAVPIASLLLRGKKGDPRSFPVKVHAYWMGCVGAKGHRAVLAAELDTKGFEAVEELRHAQCP